jgi:hypothetical protein
MSAATTKAPVLRLVPDAVSMDTIACLNLLLRRAHRGEVIGLAYCAMLKQRAYIVDTAGVAHDSPTFARGMVAALDDSLSAKIGGRA